MGVSVAPDSILPPAAQADTTRPFYRYRVSSLVSELARRDLEFLWSKTYETQYGKPLVPNDGSENDLDRLGKAICDERSNPFEFLRTDIRLLTDYLDFTGRPYNTNPDSAGFLIRQPPPPAVQYPLPDRSHIDTYVYHPSEGANIGTQPSLFQSANEDVSTGRDSAQSAVLHLNSLSFFGPEASQVGDTSSTRWTRPDARANWMYDHEFQHALNLLAPSITLSEVISNSAEALGGEIPDPPVFDVPFTWSLLRPKSPGAGNYAAWRTFTSYLAYNYRGLDTTLAGASDDLTWRWAHGGDQSLKGIGLRLQDSECAECGPAYRPYFTGLSAHERLQLLLHHWRVANYVNNPWIEQKQFGYPRQFRFSPDTTIGYWQDINTAPASPNDIVVPYDLTAVPGWRTKGVSVTKRPAGAATRRLNLEMFGSEYVAIHAGSGVTNDTLIVSVAPESLVRTLFFGFGTACSTAWTGKLFASVVTYSNDSDSLFRRPGWATAVATQSVPVDSMRDALTFTVTGFGTQVKAVLVVVSLEDGPSGRYSEDLSGTSGGLLPVRVSAHLRRSPFLAVNPQPLSEIGVDWDDFPTWAPSGSEVAFHSKILWLSPFYQIYRRRLDGSPVAQLVTSPARNYNQFRPDWSPRGDFVAFDQDSGVTRCDLWISNLAGQASRLTYRPGHSVAAAFSPNGQRIAYFNNPSAGVWELRRINLDGTNDVKLATLWGTLAALAMRWTPDGTRLLFASYDTVYQVSSNGGTVVRRDALGFDVSSFDLHHGQGQMAIAQRYDPLVYSECPSLPGHYETMLVRRVALRDTLVTPAPGDTRAWFYRAGVQFANPRWSYDGTRLAYGADPNTSGNRDLFFGEVTHNHPPKFNGLEDQPVDACIHGFQMTLSATDPDGESITYSGTYLPPGSTLNGNSFYWPNPQIGDYYTAFRAMDQSGGLDYRVIWFHVADTGYCLDGGFAGGGEGGGGGSALIGDSEAATAQPASSAVASENSLFEGAGDTGAVWDALRLPTAQVEGVYSAWIRSTGERAAAVDAARLLVVDHGSALRAHLVGQEVVPGTERGAASATLDDGTDVTASVTGAAPEPFAATPGRSVTLNLPAEGSPGPLLLEARRSRGPGAPEETGILVQVPDGSGWLAVSHVFPRREFEWTAVDCGNASVVRLVFLSDVQLRFAGRLVRSSEKPTVRWATLQGARDAKLGDVGAPLASKDGVSATMADPDTIDFAFALPPLAPGQARACFLWVDATMVADRSTTRGRSAPAAAAPPTRFALLQNRPNPFGRATEIPFALPQGSHVRLELFDVQGRLVRVLADGYFPAGYHVVSWDGRDVEGRLVKAGVYLYRIQAGAFRDWRRMALLQ